MGLTESTASSSTSQRRRSGAELARSPSAPSRISALLASDSKASKAKATAAVGLGLGPNDTSGRVAVLADGSCAFYKGRRLSQPSFISSLRNFRKPTDCHLTVHPPCRGANLRSESEAESVPPVTLEEIPEPALLRDAQTEAAGASAAMLQVSQDDLRHYIDEYNAGNPPGLDMTIEEDGSTFRGFIRVHMNLCRPISVVAGTRPPSIYDILKEDKTIEKTLTSFYLPRDTVKALHVTSETTTHEVIVVLLHKFKVVDNPKKFALYERYYEEEDTVKVKMRRIGENEKPLVLALRWSREVNCNKMFVLQENETGDILWEAFSVPELNNFLRILDREEEEYKRLVRQKYQVLGRKIQEAMDQVRPQQQVEKQPEGRGQSTEEDS